MLPGSILLTGRYHYFHYRHTNLLGKLNRIILKQWDNVRGQGWLACSNRGGRGCAQVRDCRQQEQNGLWRRKQFKHVKGIQNKEKYVLNFGIDSSSIKNRKYKFFSPLSSTTCIAKNYNSV